jgi:hypothetical protein
MATSKERNKEDGKEHLAMNAHPIVSLQERPRTSSSS